MGRKPTNPKLNRAHPLARGLVGAWPISDAYGSGFRDLGPNSLNGSLTADYGARWVRRYGDAGFQTAVVSERIVLCSATDIPVDGNATFIIDFEKDDATNRAAGLWGNFTSTSGERVGAHLPYEDGVVYWDYGGATSGTTRLTFSTGGAAWYFDRAVWAFTVGPRGMEIWRDGVKLASNTATPTRTTSATDFGLNRYAGTNGDLVTFFGFVALDRQLSEAELIGLRNGLRGLYEDDARVTVAFAPPAAGAAGIRYVEEEPDGRKPINLKLNRAHPLARGLIHTYPVLSWDTGELRDLVGGVDLGVGVGSPAKSFAPTIGPCIELGGSSSYGVTGLGASEPLRTATAGSVAAWFRKTSAGYIDAIVSMWSDLNGPRWWLGSWTSGQLRFQASDGSTIYAETAGTYVDGVWHLAVGTFEASGKVKLYIDGDLVATSSGTLGASITDGTSFEVGCWNDGSAPNCHPGDIADARIWNRVLSEAEILDLYRNRWDLYEEENRPTIVTTAVVTTAIAVVYPEEEDPPADNEHEEAGLVAALALKQPGSDYVRDRSGRGNHGRIKWTGMYFAPPQWVQDPIRGAVLEFAGDGAYGGYIEHESTTIPIFNDGGVDTQITIAVWIKGTDTTSRQTIYGEGGSVSDTPIVFLEIPAGQQEVFFWIRGLPSSVFWNAASLTTTSGPWDGEWHHIVATYDGTTGRIYCDGVEEGAQARTAGNPLGTLTRAGWGMLLRSSETLSFLGRLDDCRLYNRALSAAEIANLYNKTRTPYARTERPTIISANVSVLTGFIAPTGIEAFAVGSDSLIRWLDYGVGDSPATGFIVEGRTNSGAWSRIGTVYP